MTIDLTALDAHEQPSEELRATWKRYSKADKQALLSSGEIDDLQDPEKAAHFRKAGTIPAEQRRAAFAKLTATITTSDSVSHNLPHPDSSPPEPEPEDLEDATIYHHPLLPGLLVIPNLVTPRPQRALLDRLAHRDLSNPRHQTNLHLHYAIPYPQGPATSFFGYPPTSTSTAAPPAFVPRDPAVHKPLSIRQALDRRLHWVTLGGQYDWTTRQYPDPDPDADSSSTGDGSGAGKATTTPGLPADIAGFLEHLFPETAAQAAICNFYGPGDTMMLHRDVSERTDRGLVSLSLGCDALLMVAPDRAGDARVAELERAAAGLALGGRGDSASLSPPSSAAAAATAQPNSTSTGSSNSADPPKTQTTTANNQPSQKKQHQQQKAKAEDEHHHNDDDDDDEEKRDYLLLRLRSGDAVYMTNESRHAWHGVPKVLAGTCPDHLADWPAGDGGGGGGGGYEAWRGWMRNKRVNLNVRQMRD